MHSFGFLWITTEFLWVSMDSYGVLWIPATYIQHVWPLIDFKLANACAQFIQYVCTGCSQLVGNVFSFASVQLMTQQSRITPA